MLFYSSSFCPISKSKRNIDNLCPHAYPLAFCVIWPPLQVILVEKHGPGKPGRKSRSKMFINPFGVTQRGYIF